MTPLDPADAAAQTRARLDALAKPPGSLGRLEDLAVALAAAQGRCPPTVARPHVVVFAGDHGVARAQQVSPYPPEVTGAMVATFCAGKAAVTTLARQAGAPVEVVDVGVVADVNPPTAQGVSLVRVRVAPGTADLADAHGW